MDNQQILSVGRSTDGNPSFFVLTVLCVNHSERERIAQDGGGDEERLCRVS
jgi:hypothetical protein